jgi:uncharacterized protein YdaU (DUF1376 family)
MAEFPAFPLWTDAYLADTHHLSTIEHGAYLLLLMAMWRSNGTLPTDDRQLAKFARLGANQWQRVKPALLPFFRIEGLTMTQGRLADELQYVREHSKKQAKNARSRWENRTAPPGAVGRHPLPLSDGEDANALENNTGGDAMAMPNRCQTDAPTPTPIKTPNGVFPETGVSGTETKATPPKRKGYPAEFESAWRAYPTSQNMSKAEAFKAWAKLDAEDQSAVAKAIPGFLAYCKANPDYQPVYFDRFIRQRRFDGYANTAATPAMAESDWRRRLMYARNQRVWSVETWGPMPGASGCMVPAGLLMAGDGVDWADRRGAA